MHRLLVPQTTSSRIASQLTRLKKRHSLIAGLQAALSILVRRITFPLLVLAAGLVVGQPAAGQSGTWSANATGGPRSEAIDALTFTDVSASAGIFEFNLGWGAAWGDYDRDGYIDVMTVGHLGSICQLWHNNGDGT